MRIERTREENRTPIIYNFLLYLEGGNGMIFGTAHKYYTISLDWEGGKTRLKENL